MYLKYRFQRIIKIKLICLNKINGKANLLITSKSKTSLHTCQQHKILKKENVLWEKIERLGKLSAQSTFPATCQKISKLFSVATT